MTYDPKSPSNMLPPFLRLMCRLLGLVCFISWVVSALGLAALLVFVAGGAFGLFGDPRGLGVTVVFALFAIPLAGLVLGLRSADQLFAALRRGDYFEPSTARLLRHFAVGIVVYFLTPPLIMALILGADLANVATFPQFERAGFRFEFPTDMDWISSVLLAVFLGAIVLFASIWERAVTLAQESRRLADENAQFV